MAGVSVGSIAAGAWLALAAGHAAALSPADVFSKVAPSVWRVQTYDADGVPLAMGSGVVVAADTLITNCHVLAKAKRVSVQHEQVKIAAQLELWDSERDVCQLKAAGLAAPAVETLSAARLRVGQPVYAIGSPKGFELTMSSGLVSALRRDDA